MAGNTFKWVGGSNTNDAGTLANWLVEQSGSFVAAGTLPGTLDTITLDNGGTLNDSSGDLPLGGVAFSFAGSGGTLELGNLTLDRQNGFGSIAVGAGATATVLAGGSVTDRLQIDAAGAGATLDLTVGGTFDAQNAIFAEQGAIVNIATSAGGSFLTDGGGVAYGGTMDVAAAASGSGIFVVGGGGTMTLQSVGAGEAVVFADDTGRMVLQQTGTVGSAILGFQAGDTIDLTALDDASLQAITVNGNFTTLTDGTNTVVLPLVDSGFTAGSFATTNDGSGHVLLTTTLADATWLNGANGDWSVAGDWSSGTTPGAGSNVVIANLANTFTVTATNEAAHSVVLMSPNGVLALSGTFAVGTAILDTVGTVAVQAGATVTARAFNQIGGGGTLDMVGGAQMTLTGGSVIPGVGTLALNIDGLALLDASSLDAAAGTVLLGDNSGGNLVVQDHATLTAQSAVVTAQGFAQVQDGGLWSIAGDLSIGGGNPGSQPTVQVQDGTSLLTAGSLTVGGTISLNGGTLDVMGGSTADAAGGLVAVNGGMVSVDSSSVLNVGSAGAGGGKGLVVDAGATGTFDNGAFSGLVTNDGTILFSGFATLTGTIAGTGTLQIDAGATLMIPTGVAWTTPIDFAGSGATLVLGDPAAEQGPLLGIAPATGSGLRNTIDINTMTYNVGNYISYDATTGGLLINGGGDGTLDVGTGLQASQFAMVADANNNTAIVVGAAPCYAAGTHLATPHGARAVEHLRAGDGVMALEDGAWVARRVRWVGRTTVDLARHPHPERAAPVRIRAHAFAPDMPARDLLLSPEHAVFVDGVLMQAHALLNGATVVQEFPARITYLHVELDAHAVLCAEGLPAESYLDTGNRALFTGEHGARPLHPDLIATIWHDRACAPLLLEGPRVAAMHARLMERAATLGFVQTDDAGLALRDLGNTVRLVSRSFVPAWLGLGADRRRLGVAVSELRLDGCALPEAAYGTGWHAAEAHWRWTDGDALLHLPHRGRITLSCAPLAARYWAEPTLTIVRRTA